MAWGFKFGDGYLAKVVLILFRLAAIIWGTFYINKMIKKGYAKFLISAAFIYAGALGNLIDGAFYGMIFEKVTRHFKILRKYSHRAVVIQVFKR